MVSSETYRAIQEWIGQQLDYEASHLTPAPLTETQRKLLDKLEQALPLATPPPPEPDLSDTTNWIGLLMEYRASRQRGANNAAGIDFEEKPGPVVANVQRWYCQVQIDEHPVAFPHPGNGTIPCFARKKDAKRYAAKCAVEWLRANGYMRQGSSSVVASPQVQNRPVTPQLSPERKKQKLSAPSPEQSKSPAAKSDAIQEAQQLCARLGSPDKPGYILIESSEQPGFFSGYPVMGILGSAIPKGVGHVKEVLGKRQAKEKMAEELLVHLRGIAAGHDEADQRFLASLLPVKQGGGNSDQSSIHLRG
ncbi:hypothetical protein GGR53DRAFT_475954 [Hypoxylon sp. FL1150]|nr:hypothetical protein GGR53DRAFT_475954 [Hypoxylon sp. FL1150]